MREFSQKRKIRRMFFSKSVLLILIIICAFSIRAVFNMYEKNSLAEQALSVKMQEIESLRSKETTLNSKIDSLDTVRGLEEEVRGKFSVAKKGERAFIIMNSSSSTSENTSSAESQGFWGGLLNIFK